MTETGKDVNTVKGPEVSREIFGGVLDVDGAGHYPGLELMNLLYCGESDELLPQEANRFRLRSHDFARQLVWSSQFQTDHPDRRNVLLDEHTEDAIRHLMSCLQLPIPSATKNVEWSRAHFFPYTRTLIHWDARPPRKQGGKTQIERRYLRGGGALAYRILCADPAGERRKENEQGLAALFPSEGETPLEQLARVLEQPAVRQEEARADTIERKSEVRNDEVEELFRDGVRTILGHTQLSSVSRIRALMAWTGIWLVMLQHRRAAEYLDRPAQPLVCDCGAGHAQLRRAAQKALQEAQAGILEAADRCAERRSDGRIKLASAQRNKLRGFFWATAATFRLLNAWRGKRHFTLGLDALETLVLAAIPTDGEQTFEWFVYHWLYERCGLIVGRRAAEHAGLLHHLDASIFEDNETQLQIQMAAAGLLTQYSDATRMVSAEGLS